MSEVKVGDHVRLVGPAWGRDYDGYSAGDIVRVVEVTDFDAIWTEEVGTVGQNGKLYDSDSVDYPDYAVEVADINVTYKGRPVEDLPREALTFEQKVQDILHGMADLLVEKNAAYGNSALDPVRIFSRADTTEQLYVRLDDKINRVKQGHEYPGDDTIRDIIGYCTLILIAREGEK